MTVQTAQKDTFTFVAGLNSEAGYFTFPPNTWKDGDNVLPNISGVLKKRISFDLEEGYSLTTRNFVIADVTNSAFTAQEWPAVGGNGDLNFIVAQMGRYIHFYISTSLQCSSTKKAFSIDLNSYKAVGNPSTIGSAPIKATPANGALIITSRDTDPILVEYVSATDTITVTSIAVQIRDFEGVSDGLAVDNQPTTLSDAHKYNLFNQGWDLTKVNAYYSTFSKYPSNTQSWIYGKDSSDNYDSSLLAKQDFGTSPAPKGRYVLNVFNRDRATASGIAGLTTETESYRPTVCAFYAGRAWYAGTQSTKIGTWVMFSQVALDKGKYGRCYQDADPSSEVLSDLIDTDGGVIPIQDCGQVVDIVATVNGITVLASNGVWQITATANTGFTATGYEVKKISSLGCVSRKSVVIADEQLLYWSNNAICMVGVDQLGNPSVKSLTDLNIRTLYTDIPPVAKRYASGAYNNSTRVVEWVYNNTLTSTSTTHPYKKTHILRLDLRTTAFYTYSTTSSTSYPYIADVITSKEIQDNVVNFEVVAGNSDVKASTDNVVVSVTREFASDKQFKYWCVVPEVGSTYECTFGDQLSTFDAPYKFYDWYRYDSVGVPFTAFVLTGYAFDPNGPSKKKQALYITTFMLKTETGFTVDYDPINESSCTMQSRWDFSDSATSGKWDAGQEVYRHTRNFIPEAIGDYDDGYGVVVTKNKVRGRGKTLQLKFTADEDKDMQLAGWSVLLYGGTNV